MNNAPGSKPALGPAPVRGSAGAPGLSGRRAEVLELLQGRPSPVTIADAAGELGLHVNTVREHLDALVERGLAVREAAAARGRGRPAWTYTASTLVVEPDPRVRGYAGLATALASHIARTSSDPAADALEAGEAWGRELAAGRPGRPAAEPGSRPRARTAAARREVVGLIDELGFDPLGDARATTVALRRCPLLDAARRHPEVVCQVHLGIARGALDALGGDPSGARLFPFAEPGACRLHLARRA